MATRTTDRTDDGEPGTDGDALDRYAAIELDDGQVVIYDRSHHTAWIRSDGAVDLETAA